MASNRKKTRARQSSRKAEVSTFDHLDIVRVKSIGVVGAVTAVADFYKDAQEFLVNWKDNRGTKRSGWFRADDLSAI